jgi:glyoxylase-like metal-dependent hydrolase (beta-lactamase superfamily II)
MARIIGSARLRGQIEAPPGEVQPLPAKLRIGALDLAVLSDGTFYQDAGAVFGVVPRPLWEPVAGPLDARHRMSLALNCLLLRSGDKVILIETGVGDKPAGWRRNASPLEVQNLMQDLAALGVRPEEVDVVINSHLHADHTGWNTRLAGETVAPTFPNAIYLVRLSEWEEATNPNERTRAGFVPDDFLPLQSAGLLDLVDGERRVTDEVTIIPTPGHTDGHASVVISSAGETAIYTGDIAQVAAQFERTAWVSAYDLYPLVSMETKRALVERAIETGSVLISPHAPFPGLGRMTRTPEGYRKWTPLEAEPV